MKMSPKVIRDALRRSVMYRRVLVAIVGVGPLFIGAVSAFAPEAAFSRGVIAVTALVALVAAIILVLFDGSTEELAEELIKKEDELGNALRKQQMFRDRIDLVAAQGDLMRTLVDAVNPAREDPSNIRRHFRALLAPLVNLRYRLFDFGREECWNFAIYIYSDKKKLLECWAWERAWEEAEDYHPRDWAPGAGHVGAAYANEGEVVFPDANAPGVKARMGAGAPHKNEARYVSCAAIPIYSLDDDASENQAEVLGVVVCTSDLRGRFDPDDDLLLAPLRDVAKAAASLLYVPDEP